MDIKLRLFNWSRWSRTTSVRPASCKSLESKYKSPQIWHEPELKAEVDLLDAYKVEKGLVSMQRRDMDLLVYAYIKSNRDFDIVCRKLKIKGQKNMNKSEAFAIEQNRCEQLLIDFLFTIDTQNKKGYKEATI
jgi:hypothetical protein